MHHYLSQTGKASTLYEEMVSSTSKQASKGKRDTLESPLNRGEPNRNKIVNAKSDFATKQD
jgi:hypothetical protein